MGFWVFADRNLLCKAVPEVLRTFTGPLHEVMRNNVFAGIDIDSTQNALIEDNYFNVGDDALCVKSGIDYFGRKYAHP